MTRNDWTLAEVLPAFAYYCRTPYGKLHQRNPDIIALAERLGRTPGAVARKLTNIASCDPDLRASGRAGSANVAQVEKDLFHRFLSEHDRVILEANDALERLMTDGSEPVPVEPAFTPPVGPTTNLTEVAVRRVQGIFRRVVLSSYVNGCAMCDVDAPQYLTAAHIIPWSSCESRRCDPRNGMALCGIHDRAFDHGFVAVDDDLRIMVAAPAMWTHSKVLTEMVANLGGIPLRLPERFAPDPEALEWHREHTFVV
jgi:hypothetical protein